MRPTRDRHLPPGSFFRNHLPAGYQVRTILHRRRGTRRGLRIPRASDLASKLSMHVSWRCAEISIGFDVRLRSHSVNRKERSRERSSCIVRLRCSIKRQVPKAVMLMCCTCQYISSAGHRGFTSKRVECNVVRSICANGSREFCPFSGSSDLESELTDAVSARTSVTENLIVRFRNRFPNTPSVA